MVVISAIDEPLKIGDARAILSPGTPLAGGRVWDGQLPDSPGYPPHVGVGFARDVALKFLEADLRSPPPREADIRRFVDFLMGPEAVVPRFGSPPKDWVPLKDVMAHAAGVFAAWGNGGSIPTLLLSYVGAIVLVRFIDPVAQSAGSALADGVGATIRKAFGLSESSQIGPGGPSDNEPESR
jgi:hypothetical protein